MGPAVGECWRIGGLAVEREARRRLLERIPVLRVPVFTLQRLAHCWAEQGFQMCEPKSKLRRFTRTAVIGGSHHS